PEISPALLKESRVFCMLPWTHMNVAVNGDVRPCCMTHSDHPIGDARRQSLQEIWNSPEQRRLRRSMLEGKQSPGCVSCYELEGSSPDSYRLWANRRFAEHFAKV